jgi:endonuclease/exonuclease/phosphatase family metal-dependent hydrolase
VTPAGSRAGGRGAGLIDAFRAAHPRQRDDLGTRHGFRGGRGGERIDWILHTPHFQTLYAGIDRYHKDGRYPSDHYPVRAILRLPSDSRRVEAHTEPTQPAGE